MIGRTTLSVALLFIAASTGLGAEPILLGPVEATKQGPPLAQEILSLGPIANLTNVGVLKIRDGRGKRSEVPIRFETVTNATGWRTLYQSTTPSNSVSLILTREPGNTNCYELLDHGALQPRILAENSTMISFAGSDFWIADLGLEFLHWPSQNLLRKEIRRGQSCDVLESNNPHPTPGVYSRVVSWIDIDTEGIINAEAYDSKGKLLKEFAVTSLKKVRGQMELRGMEIDNRQTGSRTTIEFDLTAGK